MTPIALAPPVALTPEALADLARSCHADSIAAGWWEPLEPAADTAREAMRADLIGSEVGEALDALRRPERPLAYVTAEGKPDGYLVEVADTAIRALDLLGRVMTRRYDDEASTAIRNVYFLDEPGKWQHLVWHVLNRIAADPNDWGNMRRCAWVFRLCEEETARHGADLVTLINLKRAYNRTRGKRHGGLSV